MPFPRLHVQLLRFSLFASTAIMACACQSPRYKEFSSIQKGMSKGQVLELTGSPTRTQRWQGRDRWTYVYEDNPEGRMIREVHFEDGYSTYVGPQIKPEVTADNQDQINERRNREAAEAEQNPSSMLSRLGYTIQRFTPVNPGTESSSDPNAPSADSPERTKPQAQ